MLTWEEDIKPASQNNFALPPQPPISVPASAAAFGSVMPVIHGPQEAAVPAVVSHRVKASDKRIINGKTDVNQLVPFKYKWAWEK